MGDLPVHHLGSIMLGSLCWNFGSSGTTCASPLMAAFCAVPVVLGAAAAGSFVAHSRRRLFGTNIVMMC